MLRILLIDDNRHFLDSMSELLGCFPAANVIGTANCGETGLRCAAELSPDLVFVDLHMPGISGLEVAEHVNQRQPHIQVVLVSAFDEDYEYQKRAAAIGIERFVLKGNLFSEVQDILTQAMNSPKRLGASK